jgi:hypothetical protein
MMLIEAGYYAGAHRTQYDGSVLAKQNCAPTTCANGARAATGGKVNRSGGEIRALVARAEETSPATPGWSLADQDRAMTRLGVPFEVRSGGWPAVLEAHAAGLFVSLPGDSDVFGDATCSGAFDGDHSTGIHRGADAAGNWPLADPICPDRRYEKPATLRAYAEKLGGTAFRFGVFTDPAPKEDDMTITEIKAEDWSPGPKDAPLRRPVRATPDRKTGVIVGYVEPGQIVRTIVEGTTPDGERWRVTERGSDPGFLLRSDFYPLVPGGDPELDARFNAFMARVPAVDCAPLVNAARQDGVEDGLRDGARAVKDAAVTEAAKYGG